MNKKMVCRCEGSEYGFSGKNPIFSHKHYVTIGELLKKFPNDNELFNEVIRMFEEDNESFDRQRFIEFVAGKRKN